MSVSVQGGAAPVERGRSTRLGFAVGVAGFLLVVILGAAIVLTQSNSYKATTTVVILPGPSVPAENYSSYLDTLSHGQIAQTAVQIIQLKQYGVQASRELHLSRTDAAGSKVQVTVQPGTSLLTVTSTAPTGHIAEQFADTVVRDATPTVNAVSSPYVLSVVSSATNSAQSNGGLSLGKFLAVLIVVGLALAVGAQQATNQLVRMYGRRRSPPTTGRRSPGAAPARAARDARADVATGRVNGDARSRPVVNGRRGAAPPAHAPRRTKRAVSSSGTQAFPDGAPGRVGRDRR